MTQAGINASDKLTLPGETLYPFHEMREVAQTATRKMLQSAMAPHTDSDVCEDSDDEMDLDGGPARLRPLTTRHAGGNVVYSYKPAKPQDIDLWSKDMQHPRKSGMEAWSKINRLRNIYQLHPLDGVAMMCTVLNASEANKIRRVVESGLGDHQVFTCNVHVTELYAPSSTVIMSDSGMLGVCIIIQCRLKCKEKGGIGCNGIAQQAA